MNQASGDTIGEVDFAVSVPDFDGWYEEPFPESDVIPVDTSGFDHDAWFERLAEELNSRDTLADAIERTLDLRRRQAGLIAEEQRELADLAMRTRRLLPAAAKPRDVEMAMRSLTAELAVLHRVSDRTMAARIAEAETLVRLFPSTLESLELGRIQLGHVRTIVEQGLAIVDANARAIYEMEVLERAVTVTPGRLRRFAQLTAVRLAETAFEERHRQAREERRVTVTELGDGMSELSVTMPTVLADGVWDRLTRQAQAVCHAARSGDTGRDLGDPRCLDQLRADLVAELLLAAQPSADADAPHSAGVGIRAEVSVVIPMLTLLGRSDEPATISGKGPIDLETARMLAGGATTWLRILTDPVTELVISAHTYRPSQALRQFLEARDGRCRFPGCTRRARRCDADHTLAWEHGGETTPENLELLCPGHHALKHHTRANAPPWRVRQSESGTIEWTAPSGRIVKDVPDGVPSGWRLDPDEPTRDSLDRNSPGRARPVEFS
ncbi:MAG: DUF222 domain-containing protein [Cryobacterium sp.]|nr:DUF222 domain-containing protein [Micrococcales bacterium]MBX3078442.1 DUF222 domain-containing protein [Cryobacterium sp.]MBX3309873.1 DUF222 domain-containing protein [Cryobacterium sp.]MBX3391005.1 DUF222 domain-containing protein [Phycisphaeraceae bacterium]MCB1280022.1 DUF222 domain-containing protein [Salinibacterium sp.]